MIDAGLEALVDDDYSDLSYKVLNIGTSNLFPAYSAEIGVRMDPAGSHIKAVEKVMEIASAAARVGDVYHTGPISLRFVRASDAYLAMRHGRDTMMIELIMMNKTQGGEEIIRAHEDSLYGLSGRPHWTHISPGDVSGIRSVARGPCATQDQQRLR